MAGGSAGANCWFEASTTDSFLIGRADPLADGLGFVSGSFCPHYDSEPGTATGVPEAGRRRRDACRLRVRRPRLGARGGDRDRRVPGFGRRRGCLPCCGRRGQGWRHAETGRRQARWVACRRAIGLGEALSLDDVVAVAGGAPVELGQDARARVEAAPRGGARGGVGRHDLRGHDRVRLARRRARRSLSSRCTAARHRAIACDGRRTPLSREEARAMLLLRAHVLALGHSGVRPPIVDLMVQMLNQDVIPAVPQQGSLGASGDLAPLANLALPMIGHGACSPRTAASSRRGRRSRAAGSRRSTLEAKEGLALVNGTQGMLAVGILAARRVATSHAADVVAAMTIEAALGTDAAVRRAAPAAASAPRTAASAANLRRLLAGSPILASHRDCPHLVQDAYSLRCAPQVHGATRDALAYARACSRSRPAASATTRSCCRDDDEVRSRRQLPRPAGGGGAGHGRAALGLAGVDQRAPALPAARCEAVQRAAARSWCDESGLNSGFMLVQYTAASLVRNRSRWPTRRPWIRSRPAPDRKIT